MEKLSREDYMFLYDLVDNNLLYEDDEKIKKHYLLILKKIEKIFNQMSKK